MNIVTNEREYAIRFSTQAYQTFLSRLKLTGAHMDQLTISFVTQLRLPQRTGFYTYAYFDPKVRTIFIRTREKDGSLRSPAAINQSLLHETRHFQMLCLRGSCYAPEEWQMPYHERPSEIDAYQFASTHSSVSFVCAITPRAYAE